MARFDKALVWFRRDLRSFDHAALHHALNQSREVYCVFVFDKEILDPLPRKDRRVTFIHRSLQELDAELRLLGGALIVRHASATEELPRLAAQLRVDAVFANHDYEPQAIARDVSLTQALKADGRAFFSFKDQVVFEKDEVLSLSGKPFSVFTPYKNAWMKKLHAGGDDFFVQAYPVEPYRERFAPTQRQLADIIPSLSELGFDESGLSELDTPAGMSGGQALLDAFAQRMGHYNCCRDFPALDAPSRLSVHLRFGTVSVRGLVRRALDQMRHGEGSSGTTAWLTELIWRDFYFMILHHHPHVAERSFKPGYDAIRWNSGPEAEELFQAWCEGRTGFPLVDAAMMQLNQTGYMHNRLRMVTASFLVKDLGLDWHRGERYFAEKLIDYDLAANNGGWQWAASTGCDAQPYFRIFNPVTQSEKFDPDGKFILAYLPQLRPLPVRRLHAPWLAAAHELQAAGIELGKDYSLPIVQHEVARRQTLTRYAVAKKPARLSADGD